MTDLELYKYRLEKIKQYGLENNVSELEMNKIFLECFRLIEARHSKKTLYFVKVIKVIVSLVLLLILCSISLYNHPRTHSILLRNVQNFIYPGLKVFRKIAVPIVGTYPSLTEWYDEWCLLENPYFHISEMDCWPCSNVDSVQNLTGYNITTSFNIGIPYIRSEEIKEVNMKRLFDMYNDHRKIYDEDANKISSNNASYRNIKDAMRYRLDVYPSKDHDVHISWRINRMRPGRLLRKLFPRPAEVPDWWGQSTEKYVFIDEPRSPAYALPNPECSNIVMRSTTGERLIKMIPSPECRQKCRSSTVLLPAQHTLWYNWWYWRPVSLPTANSTSVSMNYLTSFC